jgi:transposase-like protein
MSNATRTTASEGEVLAAAGLPAGEVDPRRAWAQALVERARSEGVALTGEDGLLTSMVLEFPVELRKIVYTTNAIESLNARFRRAVRHRGHFPNEQAALKVLYLVATTRRQNRENMTGQIHNWKQILNALTIHYGDRLTITQ